MDYDELVTKVIDLLRREKRVPYRALKRRFGLDDDYIEDLKIDIIEAKRLAIDENDRILVWSDKLDESGRTPEPVAPPQTQQGSIHAPPIQDEPLSPPESPAPDAERRQLTVMFCDLADSTKLSGQLDPEDLRDVIRAYQSTSAEVIERYDGYIAQHLGDGLMVYFGWPQAHEDDAQRAVHAGLGILNAMGGLNARLERGKGIRLAVRVGIHTGLVVVGEMGGGSHQEQLALGETPNVASRIQGTAAPDTVAISEATYRLVEGYFICQGLGAQTFKGVAQPMAVYRVQEGRPTQSRLDVAVVRALSPLVGREQEVGLLLERWSQATAGQGQVVWLSGEAGIGKSRLIQGLREQATSAGYTRIEYRCSPYHTSSAMYPLIEHLERFLQWHRDQPSADRLGSLRRAVETYRFVQQEPDAVPLLASLLSLPLSQDALSLNLSSQRQRQKTQEVLLAWLLEETERQPVLTVWEDLHWADPSTLEFLGLLMDQTPTARLLVLLTSRPEFQPSWGTRSHHTPIALHRLTHAQVESMVVHLSCGKRLPDEVLQQIIDKSDGVPLFAEEMTKAVLESGFLHEANGQYVLTGPLPPLAIPTTLQDSLMARLDRLMTAKGVAQLGATIGRQFTYDLLRAVARLDDTILQRELSRLVESELLYQRGVAPQATYTFKHALIQDAAYQSLLRRTRQQYHQRIAQVLVEQFPETVETQPELLAHHYTEADLNALAIDYWQRAGQRARDRSANREAVEHLTRALDLLATFPDGPERDQKELDVRIVLGPAAIAIEGWAAPEIGRIYARARDLCEKLGEIPQRFPVLRGLRMYYVVRGEIQMALQLGEQLLHQAQQENDPVLLAEAHWVLGATSMYPGQLSRSREHLEQGLAFYDSQQYRLYPYRHESDTGVLCLVWLTQALWLLGYPDQARQRSHEALTLARKVAQPFSMGYVHHIMGSLCQWLQEWPAVQERAAEMHTLAVEQGFTSFLGMATMLRGFARAAQGQAEAGITQIWHGIDLWRATGAELLSTRYFAELANAYEHAGQTDAALGTIAEALTFVDKNGERYYEAEIHRLKGVSLLALSGAHETEAETCFHQALDIARQQQAKSWELRAATSLARLWQSQGKRQEAYELLAPVYNWFTEGFDTADLKDAKALLMEFGG